MVSVADIKSLEKEIKGRRAGNKAPMYIYGTEAISSYYSRVDLTGKSVLTIISSGDQAINALYFGASEVMTFDINRLSVHMLNLKVAALRTLTYAEFLKFFGATMGNASFQKRLYAKMHTSLPKRSRDFFDAAYKRYKGNGTKLAKSPLFKKRTFKNLKVGEINFYLKNERAYLRTQGVVKAHKIPSKFCNIMALPNLGKKFDIINISNIPNFLMFLYRERERPIEELYQNVFLQLRKVLKRKGRIIFYTYSPQIYPNPSAPTRVPLLTFPKELRKLQGRSEFNYNSFRFKGVGSGLDKAIFLQRV